MSKHSQSNCSFNLQFKLTSCTSLPTPFPAGNPLSELFTRVQIHRPWSFGLGVWMPGTVWKLWVATGCTEVFKDGTTRTESAFLGQGLGLLPMGWDPVLGSFFFFVLLTATASGDATSKRPLVKSNAISPKTY